MRTTKTIDQINDEVNLHGIAFEFDYEKKKLTAYRRNGPKSRFLGHIELTHDDVYGYMFDGEGFPIADGYDVHRLIWFFNNPNEIPRLEY